MPFNQLSVQMLFILIHLKTIKRNKEQLAVYTSNYHYALQIDFAPKQKSRILPD